MLIIVESAHTLHESISSELTTGLNVMKNETLYNLSLESPLLRDVDFLDNQSIAAVWRGKFPQSKLIKTPRYAKRKS